MSHITEVSAKYPIDGSRDALWMATAVEGLSFEELSADVECDIGIVGAGLTGLNAALELASKGLSVCVLEAKTVGFGASGRSGGQVNLGLNLGPSQLLEKFGTEQGRRTVDAVIRTPSTVFERIEKYALNCDPVQRGWIQGAINDRTKAEQVATVEDYAKFGCDLSLVEGTDMVDRVGTSFYTSGLLVPEAGTVQPLSYTRELARVAQEMGAKIYTHSPVESLSKVGDGWRLQSRGGSVRCRQVLVCSNGYTDGAVRGLAQRIVPVRTVLVASEPLSDELRDSVLPGELSFVDKRRLILYFRYDRHGRLCAGYHGPMRDAFQLADFDLLKSKVSAIFPQLNSTRWDYHWGGRIAMTKDSLPFFSELQPGLLACMGYCGRGVGMGTMMGINAARYLSGDCVDELAFPVTSPAKFLMHRFHKLGVNASIAWFELQELLDGRHRSRV